MKKYKNYKQTGFDWIREIPEKWEIASLKWLSNIYSGGTPSRNKPEYWENGTVPWLNSGAVNNVVINQPSELITELGYKNSSAKMIKKGSIVVALAGQGKTKGMSALVNINTTGNQSLAVVEPNEKINSWFLLYYLTMNYKILRAQAGGNQRDGLNLTIIGNLKCLFPAIQDQIKISSYLSFKISQINDLISKNNQLIQLLEEKKQVTINQAVTKGLDPNVKMKDSGIEWIGEIPEHWEIKKLKYVAEIFGRIGFRGYTREDIVLSEEDGAISLSPGNIRHNTLSLESLTYISWQKYEESPEIKIEPNDIIFVKTGSTIGKVAYIDEVNHSSTINPQLVVLKKVKIDKKFLFYFMTGSYFQSQIVLGIAGGSTPAINQEGIKNCFICIPPKNEQIEIKIFLEKKLRQIDVTIQKVISQNELLHEYRQALISNAVTGKIDVRDEPIPEKFIKDQIL